MVDLSLALGDAAQERALAAVAADSGPSRERPRPPETVLRQGPPPDERVRCSLEVLERSDDKLHGRRRLAFGEGFAGRVHQLDRPGDLPRNGFRVECACRCPEGADSLVQDRDKLLGPSPFGLGPARLARVGDVDRSGASQLALKLVSEPAELE